MTDSGYNQVLVMIDHFTKYAEAVPCITASAEETCGPPDQYVDSKTWLSNDVSIGQWNGFRRRAYERAYETVTSRSGSLHDIPPSDEWLGGKTE